MNPQVWVRDRSVSLFVCRWSTEAPLPVSIPADATEMERVAIHDVLRALEGAGLGLRFVTLEGARSAITLELYDHPVATPSGQDAGNTVTDCQIRREPEAATPERLDAELVSATLRVARGSAPDATGHSAPYSPAEFRGLLLHEFGHALGYSGHARRGPTVMVRDVDAVRSAGAALLAGKPFRDATLAALYARPNGEVLRRESVEAWRTDRVDRMARLADQNQLNGPFLRTGETRSRMYWTDLRGMEYGLVLVNLEDTLRNPRVALVAPEARTRRALPRSRDLLPD